MRSTGFAALPPVRGRLGSDVTLAPQTWFRVGGPAEFLFRPADADDLAAFLSACPAELPVTPLGVASNLLVRDGGIPGVVLKFGRGFAAVTVADDLVSAGAGALDGTVAAVAAEAGLGGLEFLSGIPGTIGGALRMNAGAYGREIKDVLVRATIIDRTGQIREVDAAALGLAYRHSAAPADWIFVGATFRAQPDDRTAIAARMGDIQTRRQATQPVRARTGGSTFANPPSEKAWVLIDRAGCRGLRRGDAMVSELHANFLINLDAATAADLEGLGEEVRRRVFETAGVTLDWEIKRVGVPLPGLSGVTP